MAEKYFSVTCTKCGLGVELEMGVLGWKSVKCPKCHDKITFDKARMQIIHCKGCDRDVLYDASRRNPCPICKRELVDTGDEHVSVVCPDCNIVVSLKKGWLGWKSEKCPKCGKKMRMRELEEQLVDCPTCQHTVLYNILKKNNCPSCGGPLQNEAVRPQMNRVSCPYCQADVKYAAGSTNVVCPACEKAFNPVQIAAKTETIIGSGAAEIAMNAELPADRLVWKHPRELLPLDSRIVSRPGYTAVIVQGDSLVAAVTSTSVALSETGVAADAAAYGDDGRKLVRVNVYYVRNAIDGASFLWGGKSSLIDAAYHKVHEYTLFGTCELAPVVDHAAFLRFIKFREETEAGRFCTKRDSRGVEETGDYAISISKTMQSVFSEALRSVRERNGYQPAMLPNAKEPVAAEIERLANQELLKWGVAVQNVTIENMTHGGETPIADPLLLETLGRLTWQSGELTVHLKDMPMAMAQLQMSGSLDVELEDEHLLRSSMDAARWLQPGSSARREIGSHIGEMLSTMFTSVFQQLIEDMNPQLEMLGTYAGYLKAQATQLINGPDEFLARHGLCGKSLTLTVKVVGKSRLYEANENADVSISELDIRSKLHEYEQNKLLDQKRRDTVRGAELGQLDLDKELAELEMQRKAKAARTSAAIADLDDDARLEEARAKNAHQHSMAQIGYAADEDKARRVAEYTRWQDDNRLEDARSEAERESLRRQREFDQSWQEKQDAYARQQRNADAQDELEHEKAGVRADLENQLFAAQENLKLSRESAQLADDMEKARFVRDLELRRQTLAEDMQRLQAEYEQRNREQALESENEKLRLMLEYLAKMGDQQVQQTSMQAAIAAAKAEADRVVQSKHDADVSERAEELRKEQNAREDLMASRAFELTKQMMSAEQSLKELELENKRAYESGRALVEAASRRYQEDQISTLMNQMEKLKTIVSSTGKAVMDGGLSGWVAGLLKQAATMAAQQPAASYSANPPMTSATRTCPFCRREIPFSAVICPHCKA